MIKENLEKLNPFHKTKKEKFMKFIKTPIGAIVVSLVLIVGASASANFIKNKDVVQTEKQEKIQQVKTQILNSENDNASSINTVGVVKAESQVNVTATTRGTVKGIFFEVGDTVNMNSILVSLYDNSTLTSLNNAQMNFANMQNNLGATERITVESINQAETGVKAAEESVKAAELALSSAENKLENGKLLREKSNIDQKNSAIISFNGYLNSIFNSLNEVDNLIDNENSYYPTEVEKLLGAKKPETLNNTKASFSVVQEKYNLLNQKQLSPDNITASMKEIVSTLAHTQTMVNNMISALDNTVTSLSFNDAMLNSQKNNFIALRSTIVNSQVSAENILRGLENIDLLTKQENDTLDNLVLSAKNQLDIAKTSYNNALISLENVKQGKAQQLISSQTTLDNARGQLNLAQAQTSDLSVKAPITGQITKKLVELGTEVSPGQILAEVQQAKNVKIEINLPSEDIYRIEKDQMVTIGENLKGMISSIAPAADPITRKVKIEIVYNNENNDLIPGTYIEVKIPTKVIEKTNSNSIFVPLRAISITQSESYVFIVENNIAKKINIITGKTEGAMIEITAGLKTGDELIIDGGKNLDDGENIEITN